jgi:hypothetical protein
MEDMRELVTVEQVESLFRVLAIAGPLVGAAVGAALGSRRRMVRCGAFRGLGIGSLAVLNYALWRMFTALTERNGLDSVANLLLNLGIFVVLGLVGGVLYGRLTRRSAVETASTSPGGANGSKNTGSR